MFTLVKQWRHRCKDAEVLGSDIRRGLLQIEGARRAGFFIWIRSKKLNVQQSIWHHCKTSVGIKGNNIHLTTSVASSGTQAGLLAWINWAVMLLGQVTWTCSQSQICKPSHLSLLNTEHTSKYAVGTTLNRCWTGLVSSQPTRWLHIPLLPLPAPHSWLEHHRKAAEAGVGRSAPSPPAVIRAAPC